MPSPTHGECATVSKEGSLTNGRRGTRANTSTQKKAGERFKSKREDLLDFLALMNTKACVTPDVAARE